MVNKKNNDETPDEPGSSEPGARDKPSFRDKPVFRDKRRVDPETGDVRDTANTGGSGAAASDPAGGQSGARGAEDGEDVMSEADQALLDQAARDLVAEMRTDMLRAQAELVNFRTRVERDRAANRESVIAEVIRSLLPVLDDLDLARAHGDLKDGAPMTIVAQKLGATFDRYGLKKVGVAGEPFDPSFHEAVVQVPNPDVTSNTVGEVLAGGYMLGERLIRAAKVAVFVPAE